MIYRAIICCSALIFGLMAALGALAQPAAPCSGANCRPAGKSRPLDLMSFMQGEAKATSQARSATTAARSGKHRHRPVRTAERLRPPDTASGPVQTPELPAPATTAYASHDGDDVQVVSSEELNIIDLAMANAAGANPAGQPSQDNGGAQAPAPSAKAGGEARDMDAPAAPATAAPARESPPPPPPGDRDDSWIGRLWSSIGDGFVSLVTMLRQFFA